jgi:lysyl-tRNA synthetase class 2
VRPADGSLKIRTPRAGRRSTSVASGARCYKDLIKRGDRRRRLVCAFEGREDRQGRSRSGLSINPGWEEFEITNEIFSKKIEPTLIQPTFVTNLPRELCPLAKINRDDPSTLDVFELTIGGMEVAPAYSEQNDPDVQRAMFEHQAGEEKQNIDHDFLLALEHGMPPAGGMGVGIDRLCILLTGAESIRDVILFPQLRPGA